jgi:hypothetical protein
MAGALRRCIGRIDNSATACGTIAVGSLQTTLSGTSNLPIVGAERVVFNVKGNAYRLVAAVDYRRAIVFIKWLGTHKDYAAIDVRTIQYATEANQD